MKIKSLVLVLFLISFIEVLACFWDKDTLEMETQEFPELIDLISGNFLRHSEEFHIWRISDRIKKIKIKQNQVDAYDDLAVSYSKLDSNLKAIETMLKKDRIKPKLYTTYANLGTMYLHNGQFEKGIEFIDKAIEKNPEAHFGREIYQRHLAEYILSKMKGNQLSLPLDTNLEMPPMWMDKPLPNFYTFLLEKYKSNIDSAKASNISKLPKDELNKAITGVSGMMKFGNYNSPILLEVLGDLLLKDGWFEGARQLSARAYLKASYEVKGEARNQYRRTARVVLQSQKIKTLKGKSPIQTVEEQLKKEIEAGKVTFENIRKNEIEWIQSGRNVEEEFKKNYYEGTHPRKDSIINKKTAIPTRKETKVKPIKEAKNSNQLMLLSIISVSIVIIGFFIYRRKKKNKK
jgi:tetratricopeptide (TPR) repeat protein